MSQLSVLSVEQPPDCVLWLKNKLDDYFLCGAYELVQGETQGKSKRKGSINLYQHFDNKLIEVYKYEMDFGVLNISLLPSSLFENAFVSANSSGLISIIKICQDSLKMEQISHIKIDAGDSSDELCLSVSCSADRIWFSTSKGRVGNFNFSLDGNYELNIKDHAHQYEVWCVLAKEDDQNICYSSSDDGYVRIWDRRFESKASEFKKVHDYGVCHLSFPYKDQNTLCCSSFDNSISFWDTRQMSRYLSHIDLGVSAWNVKWHSTEPNLAVISAMSDGCRVIAFDANLKEIKHNITYTETKSLAYSTDWKKSDLEGKNILITTSFYDRMLHLWETDC